MAIRRYVKDYIDYFPEEWVWTPNPDDSELWMKYRARRSDSRRPYENRDLWPDFSSLEKDARQFNAASWSFTDNFGIRFEGKKGRSRNVGSPDYEEHLYYYDRTTDEMEIDYDVDAHKNLPDPSIYYGFSGTIDKEWVDIKNVVNIKFYFSPLGDHIFKDCYAILEYGPSEEENVRSIKELYIALREFNKEALLRTLYEKVDDYFITFAERNPESQEIKGRTAKAFFEDCYEKVINGQSCIAYLQ